MFLYSWCTMTFLQSGIDEFCVMFVAEPGYYEPDQFGIRLETIVMVDPINTTVMI